jgi:hypothetical protein
MDLRQPDLRAMTSKLGRTVTLWTLVLTASALGACENDYTSPPTYGGGDPGWGSGSGGGGGNGDFACEADSDCTDSSQVCARDGECLDPSQVVEVHVTWTISGQPASAAMCANVPGDLALTFYSDEYGDFGFAPVPCAEGKFTIDKLPSWYTSAGLSLESDYSTGDEQPIVDGAAALDLPF